MHANTLCWRSGEKLSRETARATNGRNIIISAKTRPIIKKKTKNHNLKINFFFKALSVFSLFQELDSLIKLK